MDLEVGVTGRPERSTPVVLDGCESWSAHGGSAIGVLVVHGFTGSPASVRNVAEALADAGHHVELPRLPGHGTSIDDMLASKWDHWAEAVRRAYDVLAERVDRVVVVGQSMGGTLALRLAFERPGTLGLVCINPVTRARGDDVLEMIDDFVDDGILVAPGEGSDIADPHGSDISYPGTPLPQLRSLLVDGVVPITDRFGELTMPLRLFTSRQDHVVEPADSEHLAATYGGPVAHTWLERSFHVATRDYERDLVIAESVAFVAGLGS
jgi:carboxylesterase